jgi:hypothetical protein
MAYSEVADRVRDLLGGESGLEERKMFGGLAFLINGHMAVSVSGKGGLMVRCDPEETDRLLKKPFASMFDHDGRVMDGFLQVDVGGLKTRAQLSRWTAIGADYARSLPPKR